VSQYPSPYAPPPYSGGFDYYSAGGGDPRPPFRRAGILLIVLGAMALLFGFCVGTVFLVVPLEQFQAQGALPPELLNGTPLEMFRAAIFVMAGVIAFVGIVLIVLGIFVMRGSRGATIGGIIVCGLAALFGALQFINGVAIVATHPSAQFMGGACLAAVPLALEALAILWLAQALRSGKQMQMSQQQYLAQMWQMQQQQQAQNQTGYGYGYGQGGYGYAPLQAAPAPGSVPPPAPPASPPDGPPTRHPPLPPDANGGQREDQSNP